MSLSGIASSALSALTANATVLDVISDNVSNVNTTGYVRRTTSLSATVGSSGVSGVTVSDVSRTVSDYLDQETLTALGTSSQYETETTLYDQINALLGTVGDGNSITSQISDITTALATAAQSGDDTSKTSVLSALEDLASTITDLSASLTTLRNSADEQITTTVESINSLLSKVSEYNSLIRSETALGNDTSALCDERDQALQSLAELIDIKTVSQSDGSIKVTTTDGTLLVGDTYAQLSYTGGIDGGGYDTIKLTYTNPQTGNQVGGVTELDSHVESGTLAGLLTIRDVTISELQTELGNLALTVAEAYNDVSNDYSAAPPPSSLTGTQTGLVGTDTLGLSGTTTVAVTDADGNLVSSIAIDFDNHTYSVDGGTAVSFGDSVDDLVSALNTALGTNGSADFSGGILSITASGTGDAQGIVVQDDADGTGISDFFGLNDLFYCSLPTASATGIDGSDNAALAAEDQSITLTLRNADGTVAYSATLSIAAADASSMSIQDVIDDLNTAMNGAVTFTLNADGSVTTSLGSSYSNCSLTVDADDTERGDTGISITGLFGIGDNTVASYASSLAVKNTLTEDTLPFSDIYLDSSSAIGDATVGSGDTAGAVALQKVETATRSIDAAGGLSARTTSLSSYSSALYQDIATRSSAADDNYTTQSDRLTEAQSMQSSAEGVNLDEELANLVIYQQAYSAAARLLTTLQDLYDTLLTAA